MTYRLTDRLLKRLLAIYRRTGTVWTVEEFQRANEDRRDQARNKISKAVSYCVSEGLVASAKVSIQSDEKKKLSTSSRFLVLAVTTAICLLALVAYGIYCNEKNPGFYTPLVGDFDNMHYSGR